MRVSVGILLWNSAKWLDKTLSALKRQTFRDWEVLALDNGSRDNSVEIFRRYFPNATLIRSSKNNGYVSHNKLIDLSKSEYYMVLNHDAILEPDYLQKIVDFMDKNHKVAAACGKIFKLLDGKKTDILDHVWLEPYSNMRFINRGEGQRDTGLYEGEREVFGVSGTVPFYRREALDDIKYKDEYFDADFFAFKEDIDISWRFRYRGWQSWYLPVAVAYHVRGGAGIGSNSVLSMFRSRFMKGSVTKYLSRRNQELVLYKDLPDETYHKYWLPINFYRLGFKIYAFCLEPDTYKAYKAAELLKPKMLEKRHQIMHTMKVKPEDTIEPWLRSNQ